MLFNVFEKFDPILIMNSIVTHNKCIFKYNKVIIFSNVMTHPEVLGANWYIHQTHKGIIWLVLVSLCL